MENNKTNFPVTDAAGETHELTVYFEIDVQSELKKSGTCHYCHKKNVPVFRNSILLEEVFCLNQKIENDNELFFKANNILKRNAKLRNWYCLEDEKCIDKHVVATAVLFEEAHQ